MGESPEPVNLQGRAMATPDLPAAVVASLAAGVNPATAIEVRKAIYSHDVLTSADMEIVFEVARRAGRDPCPEWTGVFCEALTDFVVHQNVPHDYISQEKADWLAGKLTNSSGLASKAEFAMLIDVMTHALDVPTSLSTFALREIKTAILQGRRDAFTEEDHPAGAVTKVDVEALRAVLYAATTGTPGHVTQEEAEVLFEIAHATSQTKVDPAFDELFARAVGNYLMAINFHVTGRAEALHREKWLDEEESMSGFMSRMLHGAPNASSFNVLQSPLEAYEDDMAKRDADDRAALAQTEKITEPEATWAIAHLTRDGDLTSAEKRLLQFLGAEAPSIAPSLQGLVDKASKTAAFGRRS
jgi:hypothetical protein